MRVLDNLRSGFKSNLSGLDCQLIVGSIFDRDLVREAMKGVDFVFHLAAMVSVLESVQKPNECAEINAGVDKTQRAGFKPVSDLAGGLRATIEFFRKSIPRIEQGPHL